MERRRLRRKQNMDNQQIKEILEGLIKDRKERPLKNVVSQDKIDQLIKAYYQEVEKKDKK